MAKATTEEGNSSASLQAVTKLNSMKISQEMKTRLRENANTKKQIQGQIGITSNFVSHLKVSH